MDPGSADLGKFHMPDAAQNCLLCLNCNYGWWCGLRCVRHLRP